MLVTDEYAVGRELCAAYSDLVGHLVRCEPVVVSSSLAVLAMATAVEAAARYALVVVDFTLLPPEAWEFVACFARELRRPGGTIFVVTPAGAAALHRDPELSRLVTRTARLHRGLLPTTPPPPAMEPEEIL